MHTSDLIGNRDPLLGQTHPFIHKNWHDNLTPTIPVAGNMSFKFPDIFDTNNSLLGSCSATNAPANCDGLARWLAVKWSQDEGGRVSWVKGIETWSRVRAKFSN